MAAEKTLFGSDGRAVARQHKYSSKRNGSGANMDLWQRLWQDGSNSCDNTVAERTWLGGSVINRNGIDKTSETVAAKNCITGPGGSGRREATVTSRKQ